MAKTAKLIMVAADGFTQNNKYYDMVELGDGYFRADYGRVGVTKTSVTYPMSKWNSTYNSKVKKGYKDVTDLYVVEETKTVGFADISDRAVSQLIARFQAYSKGVFEANYNVSAEKVTQKQIDEAQSILNDMTAYGGKSKDDVNKRLLNLFSVLPRKMKDVRTHLMRDWDDVWLNDKISNEQDLLDTMSSQVKQVELVKENTDDKNTLLDAMGLEIYTAMPEEITLIKMKLANLEHKYASAFRVVNKKTQSKFDSYVEKAANKRRELFFHGSRNENWLSILENGLVLRPTNAVISGKMFGYGTYFADKAQKSYGYTSGRGSYWARGASDEAYMALFDVHLGNTLQTKKRESWMGNLDFDRLKIKGDYDSLFAEGGADLINNEYIVYHQDQSTIKYVIQLKG